MQNDSSRTARSGLNRLVVACRDEALALDAAARGIRGEMTRARIQRQVSRRRTFREDLGTGIVALGGIPAEHGSLGGAMSTALSSVWRLIAGPHTGDTYAVCARATEKTALAYRSALELELPDDARYGIESQCAEIDLDVTELRRLRWGAAPLTPDGVSAEGDPSSSESPLTHAEKL
jgi:hypothetical protein